MIETMAVFKGVIITLMLVFNTSATKVLNPFGYLHHLNPTPEEKTEPVTLEVDVNGHGMATGMILKSYFGRDFSSFRGMPYAPEPTRFKYPNLFDDMWPEDKYDATYFRDRCPQHSFITEGISGSENCLFLNVYSPITNFTEMPEKKLPVMFFIHGGAYITGEATYYIPTRLLDQDVVVVTINYRLGTLGFLYSGSEEAPGNAGLMDQITALRWVQKHISSFGGNPDSVTVFGQSAGGASTSWMQITPQTRASHSDNNGKDLAHKFIPMSGSALEYWTLEHDEQNSFETHAKEAGCYDAGSDANDKMVKCMRDEKSLEEIVMASLAVYKEDRHNGGLGFLGQVPVIQKESIMNRVIEKPPTDSLNSGEYLQVPIMAGSVRDEGSLVMGLVYNDFLSYNNLTNNTDFLRDDLLPLVAQDFGIFDTTNSVANSFRLAYFPIEQELGDWDEMSGPLVDLGGTMFLKSGVWSLAHEQTVYNLANPVNGISPPVYFYSFEFESEENTLFEWMFFGMDLPVVAGVCHGDDLMYLFSMPTYFNERDEKMIRRLTTLYANFAEYGNPTPEEEETTEGQWSSFTSEWLPYSPEEKNFMLLSDEISLKNDFVTRWNYNKYGYPHLEEQKVNAVPDLPSKEKDIGRISSSETSESDKGTITAGAITGLVCACAVVAVLATAFVYRVQKKKRNITTPNGQNLGEVNLGAIEMK